MIKKMIPNTTQTPNIVLDLLMPKISEGELKCLLYIIRRTFGFQKNKDRIAFSQFIEGVKSSEGKNLDYGTGLARSTVAESLQKLCDLKVIKCEKSAKGNFYEMNLEIDFEELVQNLDHQTSPKFKLVRNSNQSEIRTEPVRNSNQNQSEIRTNKIKGNKVKERKSNPLQKSIKYFKQIPKEDIKEFTENFRVTESQIKIKAQELIDWCETNEKRKKNYKAFLRTALRKDFGERTEEEKRKKKMIEATKLKIEEKKEEIKIVDPFKAKENLNRINAIRERIKLKTSLN